MTAPEGSARVPIFLTGPTASGKGAIAFHLALLARGEIISLDSMKVYRELDIATAKPSAERRTRVPYHLIDIVDPAADFTVAEYLDRLGAMIAAVSSRGRLPIVCGGTALYLKGYLSGFRSGPQADWDLRRRLIAEAAVVGPGALHDRLRIVDPAASARIHPRDLRRVVRALEVFEKTGQPISKEWGWADARPAGASANLFSLEWERADLYRRIDERVSGMAKSGLFEEAARLQARRPPLSRSAAQCIGLKEVRAGVSQGRTESQIVESIQQETRRFAKRQLTWLRKLPLQWLRVTPSSDPEALARDILDRTRAREA